MWQRKQTLYLLLTVILALVTLGNHFFSWGQHIVLILAAACNLLTIFLYKNRRLQATLCTISLFVYLGWYLALIVYSKQVAPDANQLQFPWSVALPLISMILIVMARKAIMADEKLVRDSDRLRR